MQSSNFVFQSSSYDLATRWIFVTRAMFRGRVPTSGHVRACCGLPAGAAPHRSTPPAAPPTPVRRAG